MILYISETLRVMEEETDDYLVYNPVSFITVSEHSQSPYTLKKKKRQRKNAIAQIVSPLKCPNNALENGIRQDRILSLPATLNCQFVSSNKTNENGIPILKIDAENIERKISTDSYLAGSDSPEDEETKQIGYEPLNHPQPTISRRRRASEGVRKPDGSFMLEQNGIPHWQLQEKTKSACFDYSIDELFAHVGGRDEVNEEDHSTSYESFNSINHSSTSSSKNELSTGSDSDFLSPYSSYTSLQVSTTTPPKKVSSSSDGAFDKDLDAEEMLFAKSVQKNRRPSSVVRSSNAAKPNMGRRMSEQTHFSSYSPSLYRSFEGDGINVDAYDQGMKIGDKFVTSANGMGRQDRILSLPATVNCQYVSSNKTK